jgi:MoaA/NifB/PqqE/SkfB family radical SAM enzyme
VRTDEHAGFPALTEDVTLHLTPAECVVFSPAREEFRNPALTTKAAGFSTMHVINMAGYDLLNLCDGTRTTAEVSQSAVKHLGSGREAARILEEFFDSALAAGHLEILTRPAETRRKARITGSRGFFVPMHISLELTRRCNLSCSHCYVRAGHTRYGHEMDTGRLLEVIEEWADIGLRGMELTGGEPILHERFWDVLELSQEKLTMLGVLTNGTLLDRRALDRLKEHREKLLLAISLDGATPETHDRVRGVTGSFERTVEAIGRAAERGIRVRVAMTVLPDTWREIEPALILAKRLGATWFGWSPAMPFGRADRLKWDLPSQELEEMARLEGTLASRHCGFVPVIPAEAVKTAPGWNCGIGWKNTVIGPGGLLRPCLLLTEAQAAYGDLKRESLERCLSRPVIFALRELEAPSGSSCGSCRSASYCMTCPVRGISTYSQVGDGCRWAGNTGAARVFADLEAVAAAYAPLEEGGS